jgi:hypothetical protein
VGVTGGDDGAGVAEIDLELAQVFPLFQQVRGVRMTQRMDVGVLFHAAGFQGQAEGALEGAAAHRLGGGGSALTGVAFGWEQEGGMAMAFPLLAQIAEGLFGHGHIAVPLALAGADVEEHPFGVDVAHLQTQAFAQAQAAGVDGDQGHPMIEQRHAREDGAHFGGGQDDGQLESRVGPDQFDLGGPKTAQGFFPEELDGADGLGGGLAGDLLLALEEDEVLAQFFGGDLLGGFAVVVGQLPDAVPVGLLGALADGQELEVIGVGF